MRETWPNERGFCVTLSHLHSDRFSWVDENAVKLQRIFQKVYTPVIAQNIGTFWVMGAWWKKFESHHWPVFTRFALYFQLFALMEGSFPGLLFSGPWFFWGSWWPSIRWSLISFLLKQKKTKHPHHLSPSPSLSFHLGSFFSHLPQFLLFLRPLLIFILSHYFWNYLEISNSLIIKFSVPPPLLFTIFIIILRDYCFS